MRGRTWAIGLLALALAAGCDGGGPNKSGKAESKDPALAGADDAEQKAVKALRKLGASVTVKETSSGDKLKWVTFPPTATDEDLRLLRELTNVQKVELVGAKVTDAGLMTLKDVTS